MLLQILGLMDVFAAISFLLIHLSLIDSIVMFIPCIYLIIKAIIFRGDVVSMLDGGLGIVLLLMIFGFRTEYVWLISGFLFLKGLGSLRD